MDTVAVAGGDLLELTLLDPEDASVAAHPEVAVRVLQNLEDTVVEKAFGGGEGGIVEILTPEDGDGVNVAVVVVVVLVGDQGDGAGSVDPSTLRRVSTCTLRSCCARN